MRTHILDKYSGFITMMPFFLSTTGKDIELSKKRIIEGIGIAILSGIIAGGAAVYVNSSINKAEIANIKTQIDKLEVRMENGRNESREQFQQLYQLMSRK